MNETEVLVSVLKATYIMNHLYVMRWNVYLRDATIQILMVQQIANVIQRIYLAYPKELFGHIHMLSGAFWINKKKLLLEHFWLKLTKKLTLFASRGLSVNWTTDPGWVVLNLKIKTYLIITFFLCWMTNSISFTKKKKKYLLTLSFY